MKLLRPVVSLGILVLFGRGCHRWRCETAVATPRQADPVEYELRLDEQTADYLRVRQQLAYFLVTASGVIAAFILDRATEQQFSHPLPRSLLLLSGGLAVVVGGSALLAIQAQLRSYSLHLQTRLARQSFEALPVSDQEQWTRYNERSRRRLRVSMIGLWCQLIVGGSGLVVGIVG